MRAENRGQDAGLAVKKRRLEAAEAQAKSRGKSKGSISTLLPHCPPPQPRPPPPRVRDPPAVLKSLSPQRLC